MIFSSFSGVSMAVQNSTILYRQIWRLVGTLGYSSLPYNLRATLLPTLYSYCNPVVSYPLPYIHSPTPDFSMPQPLHSIKLTLLMSATL